MTDNNLQPKLDAGTGGSIEALIEQWKSEARYCLEQNGEPDAVERAAVYESCAADLSAALLTRRDHSEQSAQQLIGDVLEEYAEERTKEACDACAECSEAVMCRFHSLLSALDRGAWTNPAIERDNLRRRIKQLETEALTRRDQLGHVFTPPHGNDHPHCIYCGVPEHSSEATWQNGRCDKRMAAAIRRDQPEALKQFVLEWGVSSHLETQRLLDDFVQRFIPEWMPPATRRDAPQEKAEDSTRVAPLKAGDDGQDLPQSGNGENSPL